MVVKREATLRDAVDFLIPLKAKPDTLESMMSAITAMKKKQGAIVSGKSQAIKVVEERGMSPSSSGDGYEHQLHMSEVDAIDLSCTRAHFVCLVHALHILYVHSPS